MSWIVSDSEITCPIAVIPLPRTSNNLHLNVLLVKESCYCKFSAIVKILKFLIKTFNQAKIALIFLICNPFTEE